jgi:hypothetical protein
MNTYLWQCGFAVALVSSEGDLQEINVGMYRYLEFLSSESFFCPHSAIRYPGTVEVRMMLDGVLEAPVNGGCILKDSIFCVFGG